MMTTGENYVSFKRKDVKFITIDPKRNHTIHVHENNDIVVIVDSDISQEEENKIIHEEWIKHFAP